MQLIFLSMLHILCAGDAHHLLEGGGQLLVIQFPNACHNLAKFDAPGGFYDNKISRRGPIRTRVKEIKFSGVLKSNANYIYHRTLSSIRLNSSFSTTACQVT